MIICAAADIHYPREGHEWCIALAREMCTCGADVIVLAGDICVGGRQHYAELLGMFADFDGPRLFVPGNHDLWDQASTPSTLERYNTWLPQIVGDHGFHYLPHAPTRVGNVGFVGTVGWWDYAFRQTRAPRPGLRATPMQAARGDSATKLLPISGRANVPWEELTAADYAGKALVWGDDGTPQSLIWNDAIYTDWGQPDEHVVRQMAQDIMRDADEMADGVGQLIGVCHFVPFEGLLPAPADDVSAAYCRAYMGSPLLGEAFLSHPKFSTVMCGHLHMQKVIEAGRLVVTNCSVGDKNAGPLLLTLPEDEDQ